MPNTEHRTTTTNKKGIIAIIIFALLLALFLLWYFSTWEPVPKDEGEAVTQLDSQLTEGSAKIVENVAKTEELCNKALKSFGFSTDQAMDGWYDFDEEGHARYYAKTKFGNFSIATDDPDSGEYVLYPQDRYVIGNIDARDVDNLRTDKYLNQSQLNCKMFYVAEETEKECIYVDVWNNKAYKTTYLMEEHLYKTKELTGQEAEKYAYR